MRTVPYTSSVTSARSRASSRPPRSISGTRMCANAPSSMRNSASSAVRRADCGASVAALRGIDGLLAAQSAEPRARVHRALAFGLHLVEYEGAAHGAEPPVLREHAHVERVGNRVGSPHLHAPTSDREPRAGPRVARAHYPRECIGVRGARIEAELLDGQLLGIRRLADLRHWSRGRDSRQLIHEQHGPDVDEARTQLTRGLLGCN